ncbi:putative ecotin [Leptomonas pyrrhocoris]|uniref:Putative ecotin n=1 Tax=Leptomonas pyrrhocoris TaxID=157538 RepID=A0A0M9FSN4_LEPPY|nr:putative ecotin [Leptomonas pyrrhocoris]KPA75177.1 putative ecotin [Leptomonas pyrrhocoris]|eukprot:XP_015653616.1 putative ecotin [Leptomonas pyrrhocoris]
MPTLSDFGATYPAAAPGQERKVIYLPSFDPRVEADHMRVQLIPGRHEDCEDGRLYNLTGTISEGTIEGWGYSYYVVTLGDIYAAHRTPADAEGATTFVAMYENPIITYNSRLPVVVYMPEGTELRYRIWRDELGRTAEETAPAAAPAPQAARHRSNTDELDNPRRRSAQVKEYPEPAASRDIPPIAGYEQEGGRKSREYVAEAQEAPALRAEEGGRKSREYVAEAQEAPALRASEKAGDHDKAYREKVAQERQQELRAKEAQPDDRREHRKSDPNSERRRHSSTKPRKHSSSEVGEASAERQRRLSSTENSPSEGYKRLSVDKGRSDSAASGRPSSTSSNGKEGAYEKKAKNFWNRARGNSKSKDSSPKKSGSNGEKWSEM